MSPHEQVPGGYMNENKIHMHRLNLDFYGEMRMAVVKEMQNIMQWWTQMKVRHTSTYGVRIYRRDAMLIDHVDRGDTHLASAVIQVTVPPFKRCVLVKRLRLMHVPLTLVAHFIHALTPLSHSL
jgi:hypothetical protein